VRVPRSYAPPHRVIYKNRSRFWARASSGKYEPNVESCATSSPRRLGSPSASPPFEPIVSSGLQLARHQFRSAPAQGRASPRARTGIRRRPIAGRGIRGCAAPTFLCRSTAWGRKSPRNQYRRFLNYADRPAGGRQSYASSFARAPSRASAISASARPTEILISWRPSSRTK